MQNQQKLTQRVKIGYGLGELGPTSAEVLIRVSLLIFYTDYVGLRPDLAGLAVALGVVWDAITDPLMGRISDRWQSSFGRRRPFILAGGLWLAVTLVVLFSPPLGLSQAGIFSYLVLSYILVNTGITIVSVPHAALAGDMSSDSTDRAAVFGWRLLAANIGMILGTAVPGVVIVLLGVENGSGKLADHYTAIVLAIVCMLTCLVSFLSTKGFDHAQPPAAEGETSSGQRFLPSLLQCLSNKPFVVLFAGYVIANIGLSFNATFALYYYRYRLELVETDVRGIIAFFMVVFCFSLPLWILAARRFAKKYLLFSGIFGLGLMSCVAYPLFPSGEFWWPMAAGFLGGLLVGSIVLLEVMLADTVDYDEIRTAESQMGLYFGLWKLGAKGARAFAVALAGFLLSVIGFQPNQLQSPETSFWLSMIFGPGVGIFFIVGASVVLLYPLGEPKIRQIQRILSTRKLARERASND